LCQRSEQFDNCIGELNQRESQTETDREASRDISGDENCNNHTGQKAINIRAKWNGKWGLYIIKSHPERLRQNVSFTGDDKRALKHQIFRKVHECHVI
jgi:hypothetical protein